MSNLKKKLWGLFTTQKMKFSIKDFFSKCDQTAIFWGFVTFTEEILIGKLHFLCSGSCLIEFSSCLLAIALLQQMLHGNPNNTHSYCIKFACILAKYIF